MMELNPAPMPGLASLLGGLGGLGGQRRKSLSIKKLSGQQLSSFPPPSTVTSKLAGTLGNAIKTNLQVAGMMASGTGDSYIERLGGTGNPIPASSFP
jgi:hypothetical protein